MSNQIANAMPPEDPFDPTRLRLSQDFGEQIGVKKALLTVPVRKPDRQWFVRAGERVFGQAVPLERLAVLAHQPLRAVRQFLEDEGHTDQIPGGVQVHPPPCRFVGGVRLANLARLCGQLDDEHGDTPFWHCPTVRFDGGVLGMPESKLEDDKFLRKMVYRSSNYALLAALYKNYTGPCENVGHTYIT